MSVKIKSDLQEAAEYDPHIMHRHYVTINGTRAYAIAAPGLSVRYFKNSNHNLAVLTNISTKASVCCVSIPSAAIDNKSQMTLIIC